MRLRVVIENHSDTESLLYEYGLSFYVKSGENAFLLDCGASDKLLHNLAAMGIDSEGLSHIVISHNHGDHIGGLGPLLAVNSQAGVYVAEGARRKLYTKRFLSRRSQVSRNDLLAEHADRITYIEGSYRLFDNVYLCTVASADSGFCCRDRRLRMMDGRGRLLPDDFSHELYVAVIEEGHMHILSSCSHKGIVNILADAAERFPDVPIESFFGGLHFKGTRARLNCSPAFVIETAEAINRTELKRIYTCHCTGKYAFDLLREHLSAKIRYLKTGSTLEV